MKMLSALAALFTIGAIHAGEPMQAPVAVYLPTAVAEQAPAVLPVPEAAMDVPSTVLLAVNQCPNGQCTAQRGTGFTTLVNPSYAPVQAPRPSVAAPAVSGCTNCGCAASASYSGVQAAPVASGRPRLFGRLFAGGPRLKLFGGPGLFAGLGCCKGG